MALTFLKKKQQEKNNQSLLEMSKQMKPIVEVPVGSDLEKQLKMLDLTVKDFAVAQVLKPFVEEEITAIINVFYKNLEHNPELIAIIENNSSIDRLKKTLRRHIVEMFSGEMNETFIHKRKVIAQIHVKIGLEQKWYIASFEKIFNGLMEMMLRQFQEYSDRILALNVMNKLLNLEQQVVVEAYDDEVINLKEQEVRTKTEMIDSLEQTSNELATLAEQTNASIEEMTAQADVITSNSQVNTSLAEKAKESADEGKNRLTAMNSSLENMELSTTKVSNGMASLEDTSTKIKDIIGIVKSVADQTNLLALNASIEAARAGEHGSGFAVVADEVRKLAEETGKSVTNVADLINHTNEQISTNASSMKEVEDYLAEVREHMQKTENAFTKISEGMEKTKSSNKSIQDDLEGFDQVIQDIGQSATTITESADNLYRMIEGRDQ